MTRDGVRKALEAIEDEAVRARVVDGDFDPVADVDLSDDERAILQAAATDYPDEVSGFDFFSLTAIGAKVTDVDPTQIGEILDDRYLGYRSALDYIKISY